jgi:hypothetical protein
MFGLLAGFRPPAPTTLSSSNNAGSVALAWGNAGDNTSDIQIERNTGSWVVEDTIAPGSTSYVSGIIYTSGQSWRVLHKRGGVLSLPSNTTVTA